jgi:hypothetical protein
MSLVIPTNLIVSEYLEKFNTDIRAYKDSNAISSLLNMFPNNKVFGDIRLKVSVINDLYGTGIFATYQMSQHIFSLDIDKALQNGDVDLVARIALGHSIPKPKNPGERNFYSFATKYCSWHNPDAFPIYDSRVNEILIAYRTNYKFAKFEDFELQNYKRFKEIVLEFKEAFSLTACLTDIDKYLWYYRGTISPPNWKQIKKK